MSLDPVRRRYGYGAAQLCLPVAPYVQRRPGAALRVLRATGDWTGAVLLGALVVVIFVVLLSREPDDELELRIVPFQVAAQEPDPPVELEPPPAPPPAKAEPPPPRKPPVARPEPRRPKPPPVLAMAPKPAPPAPPRERTERPRPRPAARPKVRMDAVAPVPEPPPRGQERRRAPTRKPRRPAPVESVRMDAVAPPPEASPPPRSFRGVQVARARPRPPTVTDVRIAPVRGQPEPAPRSPSPAPRRAPPARRARRRTRDRGVSVAPASPAPSARDRTAPAAARATRASPVTSGASPPPRRPETTLRGVPLGSLAACVSDRREDALKQRVIATVGTREECRSSAGRYRFVETKNLNAFLIWVERAAGRAEVDRCGELELALRCLER